MPVVTLIVASGAAWEPRVLTLLDRHSGVVVLKRCVDVDDLLAAAAAGQADAAVVGIDAPGLDAVAVDHLRQHGVRPVAIVPGGPHADAARLRAGRIGLRLLVGDDDLDALPGALSRSEEPPPAPPDLPAPPLAGAYAADGLAPAEPTEPRRVVAVWGPAGAPGRTTVATGIAAELARRQRTTLLVDADPYGGAVAQQLGVLDEVSGLLSAARLATSGELTSRFLTVPRMVGPHLGVVTGLPRPDRWAEVRAGAVEQLVEAAGQHGGVVVDTGFSLEEEPGLELGTRPGRNLLTLAALDCADEVVVVGTADPVGLTRLARGLVDLADRLPGMPLRVVVNRMRPSLGWSEREVAGMVTSVLEPVGLHFLPDDRACVDRALVAGCTLVETAPDAPLPRAIAAVVDAIAPDSVAAAPRRGRRRRRAA